MNPIDQIRIGIDRACTKQRISIIEAAERAGLAPSILYRFIGGGDIRLTTLAKFFKDGLGLKFETVLRMGRES